LEIAAGQIVLWMRVRLEDFTAGDAYLDLR